MVLETGLSADHHKMIISVMKSYFPKMTEKMVNFRSYSKFHNAKFKNQLATEINIDIFENVFTNILNEYSPIIRKCCNGLKG